MIGIGYVMALCFRTSFLFQRSTLHPRRNPPQMLKAILAVQCLHTGGTKQKKESAFIEHMAFLDLAKAIQYEFRILILI